MPSFATTSDRPRRALLRAALALPLALALSTFASAHGSRAGEIRIGHPYATPSLAGTTIGAAYIAKLENGGDKPDRLLRASTPVSASVQLHSMSQDAQGVMRMREVGEIALAPGQAVRMRPGGGFHLMLMELKKPLREGDRFPLTLVFEKGGTVDVEVVVQKPPAAGEAGHMH